MSRRDSGPVYKITVLGDGGVGKTALTIQLCLNHFVETYDPTIVDSYRKKLTIDGEASTLEVLDTAGQEEYTSLRDQWIRDGEGFILVYSITSRSSFSRIQFYHSQIQRVKEDDPFFCVLVGNKSDCPSEERAVSATEGEALAKKLNMPFFESSAKLNINIEDAFLKCARACKVIREVSKNPPESSPTGKLQLDSEDASPASQLPNNPATHTKTPQGQPPTDKVKSKKKKDKCVVF